MDFQSVPHAYYLRIPRVNRNIADILMDAVTK